MIQWVVKNILWCLYFGGWCNASLMTSTFRRLFLKPVKDPVIFWDGYTHHAWNSNPINDLNSKYNNIPIVFLRLKSEHFICVWDLCITYIDHYTLLCETNFKACFINTKRHPDTEGDFGFAIENLMYILTGIVLDQIQALVVGIRFSGQHPGC